ncbi:MAG: aminodeoxychorismate/anthranilate synthase component II [Pseudobdellovibrionaceae bacterium]|jgi:anthranilate synthase component 2|nr:aminodeoxychorismate/anthranilate synthase component II [Pseudobdellovibrionaceae bacterium]
MIVVIDNYDSFVHNLARYIRLTGKKTEVIRNDSVSIEHILRMTPEALIISPGPCAPKDAGISEGLIRESPLDMPILGVCLGHQAIGEVFGAKVTRAQNPMHGRYSLIHHTGDLLFRDVPSTFRAGRYHSLAITNLENTPLDILAYTDDGEVMAVKHKSRPIYGVQFHPESVLTENGQTLINNFIGEIL